MSIYMTNYFDETDPLALILGIDDPEERARMAREFGLAEELARRGHFGHGNGPEVVLNAAIHGGDEQSRLRAELRDDNLVADELARRAAERAAKARAARFLTLDEVRALYDATAFLNQELGLTWTAFLTIAYEPLGVDGEDAGKLLARFLDEAAKFMRRAGHEFHWIYVHERSDVRGLHTHVLAHLPVGMRLVFTSWALDDARSFFRRHCQFVRPGAVDFDMKEPKTRRSKVQWQGNHLQYVTKGLDPEALARDPGDGKMKPVLDLLKQKSHFRRPAGMVPFKVRCGGSRTVWRSAQAAVAAEGMPILSAFQDEAWQWLYLDGAELEWPLREYDVRQRERELRGLLTSLGQPVKGGSLSDPRAWARDWPVWP